MWLCFICKYFFFSDEQIDETTFLDLTEYVIKEIFDGDPISHRVKFYALLVELKAKKKCLDNAVPVEQASENDETPNMELNFNLKSSTPDPIINPRKRSNTQHSNDSSISMNLIINPPKRSKADKHIKETSQSSLSTIMVNKGNKI